MAKENEKKLSADMNSDEMENVSGGMCAWGGISSPPEVKSVKKQYLSDGSYKIITTFKNGSQVHSLFDANGNLDSSAAAKSMDT